MAKTFYPEISKNIPASPPHPKNTKYKVSVGLEYWSGKYVSVVKVQMIYDGIVSGRRSPSYPVGSSDFEKVSEAINELIKEKTQTFMGEK